MNALFDSFSFHSRLQEQVQAAIDSVAGLTDAELNDVSTSELAERLFEAHLPDLPKLDLDGITKSTEMAQLQYRQVAGFAAALSTTDLPKTSVVAFYVPYSGEPKWFEAIPSKSIGERPRGVLLESVVKLYVLRGTKTAKQAHKEFLAQLKEVTDALKTLEDERAEMKAHSMDALCLAIDDEKAHRERDREFMDELPYPYR